MADGQVRPARVHGNCAHVLSPQSGKGSGVRCRGPLARPHAPQRRGARNHGGGCPGLCARGAAEQLGGNDGMRL
jgi:hypothetical protein